MALTTIIGNGNGNGAFQVTTKIIEFSASRTRAKAGSQQSPNQIRRNLETENRELREENQRLRSETDDLRRILRDERALQRSTSPRFTALPGATIQALQPPTTAGSVIDPIDLAVRGVIADRTPALAPRLSPPPTRANLMPNRPNLVPAPPRLPAPQATQIREQWQASTSPPIPRTSPSIPQISNASSGLGVRSDRPANTTVTVLRTPSETQIRPQPPRNLSNEQDQRTEPNQARVTNQARTQPPQPIDPVQTSERPQDDASVRFQLLELD